MPPGARTAAVRAEFKDDFTAQAAIAEVQAHRTGRAFKSMGGDADGASKGLKKNRDELDKNEKSSDKLDKAVKRLNQRHTAMQKIFGMIGKPMLYAAVFQTAVPAVFALSAGVLALASNMGRMVGVGAALPGIIFAIGTAAIAAVVGLKGMGAAVKALNDGDPAKINEALKNMSPQARMFARDLIKLKPAVIGLRMAAQQELFPGLRASLASMVRLMPTANNLLRTMGRTVGNLAMQGAQMLSSGPWQADFNFLIGRSAEGIQTAGTAAWNFLDALRHVTVAAAPLVQKIADLVLKASVWAQTAAFAGRESGRMAAFFDRAFESMKQWGRVVANLTIGLFKLLGGGAAMGQDLADSIEHMTRRFRDWTSSTEGQRKITEWFNGMRPIVRELGHLFGVLSVALFRISEANKDALVGEGGTIGRLITLTGTLERTLSHIGPNLGQAIVELADAFLKLLNALPLGVLSTTATLIARLASAIAFLSAVPGVGLLVKLVFMLAAGIGALQLAAKLSGIGMLIGMVQGMTLAFKGAEVAAATSKAQVIGFGIATRAQTVFTAIATAAQWAWNAAMLANPVGIVIVAIVALIAIFALLYLKVDRVRRGVDRAWQLLQDGLDNTVNWFTRRFNDMVSFVTGLPGRIADAATGMWDGLKEAFKTAINWIITAWNALEFDIPGFSIGPVSWGGFTLGMPDITPLGDTSRARGVNGNLAQTLGLHNAIRGGYQQVTNALYGRYASSDHLAGRALDLVGSGLNGYKARLEAAGGFAEFHGSGPTRHLHAVYGDTAQSRRLGGGGREVQMNFNAPLVGVVHAASNVDVKRAVKDGIREFAREFEERG